MKILLVLLSVITIHTTLAQQTTTKDAWLEKWENSKNYLVGIAEAMPEEHYNFKPTERQMTFKEQLVHIKENMDWLSNTYFTKVEFKKTKAELPLTKAETITLITEAFDKAYKIISITTEESLLETVDFFAGPKSRLQILNLLHDHVTHHRGQLIVYLNLNNVEPPAYSGW
ncbi:MAG: DinB family protein [Flavobacteriaceae bacterium]|nr:DinB family protein [Flavobacteriaceae bacterium]|tara:strand:+ start:43 stop:555 length:513 start_codon:yes stop_codon:yes gene_type:complete